MIWTVSYFLQTSNLMANTGMVNKLENCVATLIFRNFSCLIGLVFIRFQFWWDDLDQKSLIFKFSNLVSKLDYQYHLKFLECSADK